MSLAHGFAKGGNDRTLHFQPAKADGVKACQIGPMHRTGLLTPAFGSIRHLIYPLCRHLTCRIRANQAEKLFMERRLLGHRHKSTSSSKAHPVLLLGMEVQVNEDTASIWKTSSRGCIFPYCNLPLIGLSIPPKCGDLVHTRNSKPSCPFHAVHCGRRTGSTPLEASQRGTEQCPEA